MAVIPQRKAGGITLPYLWDKYGRRPSYTFNVSSPGYSVNMARPVISEDNPIINNPYGSELIARIRNVANASDSVSLTAGQSYNFLTGQYSDPNISATTAANLNSALNMRRAQEAGLSQSQATTARQAPSVLASLDEMYWGHYQTKVTTATTLTGLAQANQQGMSEGSNKTILGTSTDKKPVKLPTVRALT